MIPKSIAKSKVSALFGTAALAAWPHVGLAEMRPTLNFYGVPGLIDMPGGHSLPDGVLALNVAQIGPSIGRRGLTFQITPRLQGSFRYSGSKGLLVGGFRPDQTYYDRSFDLRFRLLDESRYIPAVTIGLQDFVGTSVYSGEFIAASKTFGNSVRVTAGLGWGRLGSAGGIGAPFGPRPPVRDTLAGSLNFSQWFRGPAAPFAGIEWHPTDRLGLKLEYSSDAYDLEDRVSGILRRKSPINFGMEYQLSESVRVGAYYLYGTTVGLNAQIQLNPKKRPTESIQGPAPFPIVPRPDRGRAPEAYSTAWLAQSDAPEILAQNVQKYLNTDNLTMESLRVGGDRAEVRVREGRWDSSPQMIGRVARAMAANLPASVETFDIVPVVRGMAVSRVTIRRSDLEVLEFAPDNANQLRARAVVSEADRRSADSVMGAGLYPRFRWALLPYSRLRLFGYEDPIAIDLGLRLSAAVDIAPGLELSGSITKRFIGNLKNTPVLSNSVLPHVRSDIELYDRDGDLALETLILSWHARPATNVYSRVSLGYLERMFGGVSAEVLWKPVNSRFALGAEVNYVKQRETRQRLGFQNYKVATGHVSGYYDFGNGFHAQVDVGRYLAGDVGATLTLERQFENGWRIGAFATKTNVSAAQFGNGGFDKGIRVTMPLNWISGRPISNSYTTTIRPFTRDGGARLEVPGRLYESVRRHHGKAIDDQWGRFWR